MWVNGEGGLSSCIGNLLHFGNLPFGFYQTLWMGNYSEKKPIKMEREQELYALLMEMQIHAATWKRLA